MASASGIPVQPTSNSGGHGVQHVHGGKSVTEKHIDFLCDLHEASNERSASQSSSPRNPVTSLRKLGVARSTWVGERQLYESRKESRKADFRQDKTDIHQMIGFYTVVQGVLFQGVSSMARTDSCRKVFRFSVALSALTSIAILGGIFFKLLDLYRSKIEFTNALRTFEKLEGLLTQLEVHGQQFDWKNTETDPKHLKATAAFEKKDETWLKIFSLVVMLLLLGFSVVFPFSFREILCGS